jgi:hypothetical protein
MALPTYPSNQLDDPDLLVGLCGSFWQSAYLGRDQALAFAGARGQLDCQVFYDIQNLANCGGWRTTPLYRLVRWFPMVVLASQAVTIGAVAAYPMPAGLVAVASISNQLSNPAVVLIDQIDFTLDATNQQVDFATDPFINPLFEIDPVFDAAGNIVDSQLTLWLYQGDFDEDYLANTYGYVFNFTAPSSLGYQRAIGALWDSMVSGTSLEQLSDLLTALTGAQTAFVTGEIVQYVTSDLTHLLIITDQNVYRFNIAATAMVAVGDVLQEGQFLVDTFIIDQITNGVLPSTWATITLPANFFNSAITGPLTFTNSLQATTYIANDGFGYAELQFPITGAGGDVSTFRTQFQANGRLINQTLAMSLDNRPLPHVGQPGPTNVPTQLNPAALVTANVLRYHAVLVTIKQSQLAPDAFGLSQLTSLIRQIVPPWQTAITRLV